MIRIAYAKENVNNFNIWKIGACLNADRKELVEKEDGRERQYKDLPS